MTLNEPPHPNHDQFLLNLTHTTAAYPIARQRRGSTLIGCRAGHRGGGMSPIRGVGSQTASVNKWPSPAHPSRAHARESEGPTECPARPHPDPGAKRKTLDLGRCRPGPGGGPPGRGDGTQVARGSLAGTNA